MLTKISFCFIGVNLFNTPQTVTMLPKRSSRVPLKKKKKRKFSLCARRRRKKKTMMEIKMCSFSISAVAPLTSQY